MNKRDLLQTFLAISALGLGLATAHARRAHQIGRPSAVHAAGGHLFALGHGRPAARPAMHPPGAV